MRRAELSRDGTTLTVRVPFALRKRGGRKLVVAPDGAALAARRPRVDNTLVKALARAQRWKRMLESGRFGSLAELAEAEKINKSYLSRVLRLTLLAPDIVEAILDGWQPEEMTLDTLLKPFPVEWDGQRVAYQVENEKVARRCGRIDSGNGLRIERKTACVGQRCSGPGARSGELSPPVAPRICGERCAAAR